MAKKKVNTESQGNAALNMMAQMMASMQGGNAPDSIPAPNVPVETPPVPAAAIGLQSQVVDRLKAEIADLEAELKGIGKPTKRHAKELRDELKAELENRKKVLKQMSGAGSAGGSKPGEGGKAQSKRGKSGYPAGASLSTQSNRSAMWLRRVGGLAVAAVLLTAGCDEPAPPPGTAEAPPPGTAENLRADYERVVRERDELKANFEKEKGDIDKTWRQRVADKEQKITELTADNANLRQRLLTVESAMDQIPLVDAARSRSVMWLHLTYGLIIFCFLLVLAAVLWVHANLRERVRMYVMQQAKLVRSREIVDVDEQIVQR